MRHHPIRTGLLICLTLGLGFGFAGCTGKGEAIESSSADAETEAAKKKDEDLVPVVVENRQDVLDDQCTFGGGDRLIEVDHQFVLHAVRVCR